nr:guanine nucleotide exchange factor spike 1 [Quercus suber]
MQFLAFFCYDLLSIIEPRQVFELISLYLDKFSGAKWFSMTASLHFCRLYVIMTFLWKCLGETLQIGDFSISTLYLDKFSGVCQMVLHDCKLTFLQIICDHDLFVEMPGRDPSDRNYLSSVLIQEIFLTWDHDDLSLRAKAARILVVLLCKHEFDARYQKPEDKLYIAQLYFPLIGQILDEMPVFYNLNAVEKREVLIVILQIVRNLDDASLVKAWQQSIARTRLFFKLLEECLVLFEHRKPADGMLMGCSSRSPVGDGPASPKYSDRLSPAVNNYLSEASRQEVRHRKPAAGMLMGCSSRSPVGDGPASPMDSDRLSPAVNNYLSEASRQEVRLEESGEARRLRKSLEEMSDEAKSPNLLRECGLSDSALVTIPERSEENRWSWSEVKYLSDSLLLALMEAWSMHYWDGILFGQVADIDFGNRVKVEEMQSWAEAAKCAVAVAGVVMQRYSPRHCQASDIWYSERSRTLQDAFDWGSPAWPLKCAWVKTIVGEARDLGPRYTTVEDLAPVRDESIERVSQSRRAHIPVGVLKALVRVAEPASAESVNSSNVEASPSEKMVKRKTMIFDQFFPSAHPTAQSQPQGEDRASPSLAGGRVKKKQRVVDQPPRVTSDAPLRTLS